MKKNLLILILFVLVTKGYSNSIVSLSAFSDVNKFLAKVDKSLEVGDFLIIPKQFFTNEILVKRNPLSYTVRRAGWIGCNIDVSSIADFGFNKTFFLRGKYSDSKGWLLGLYKKEAIVLYADDCIKTKFLKSE